MEGIYAALQDFVGLDAHRAAEHLLMQCSFALGYGRSASILLNTVKL
jgi:hypothetical protein